MACPWYKGIQLKTVLLVALPLLFLVAGIGLLADQQARQALTERAREQLVGIRESRRLQLEALFERHRTRVRAFSADPTVRRALVAFSGAMKRFPAQNGMNDADVAATARQVRRFYEQSFTPAYRARSGRQAPPAERSLSTLDPLAQAVQASYLADPSLPGSSRDVLRPTGDDSGYGRAHQRLHPALRAYQRRWNYGDLLLVDARGRVVYAAEKGLDFATSLRDGPYARTGLAQAFREAMAAGGGEAVVLKPFLPYLPAFGRPAGFIASPVLDEGAPVGALVLRLPLGPVNAIMTSRGRWPDVGLGRTGETLLVAGDHTLRNDARLYAEDPDAYREAMAARGLSARRLETVAAQRSTALVQRAAAPGVEAAFQGRHGVARGPDYRGRETLVAYAPVSVQGLRWALLAKMDMAEVNAPMAGVRAGMGAVSLALAVLAVLAAAFLARRVIARPLERTVDMIDRLGRGELTRRLHMRRSDEIGLLARALDGFADSLEHEVVAAFDRLAAGDLTFRASGVIGAGLASTNGRLTELLAELRQAGHQIATGSEQIARANQTLSQGATEQASALEEISTSVSELASQTRRNAEHAGQANDSARTARSEAEQGDAWMTEMNGAMGEINEASEAIAKIIKVIDDIAFQTNLLSLNAAVEAGRAGRHGRGFAVVAEEVRKLATKSAEAARETAELIERSQTKAHKGAEMARGTAAAFGGIREGISQVTDLMGEIAAASNEQANGLSQISTALSEIDRVTQDNSASTEESAAAASELASQAAQMQEMLAQFRLADDTAHGEAPGNGGNGTAAGAAPDPAPAPDEAALPEAPVPGAPAPAPADQHAFNDREFGRF